MGGDFIYIVFSKDRPAKIDQVRSLVGELFEDIHWFVADGSRKGLRKSRGMQRERDRTHFSDIAACSQSRHQSKTDSGVYGRRFAWVLPIGPRCE